MSEIVKTYHIEEIMKMTGASMEEILSIQTFFNEPVLSVQEKQSSIYNTDTQNNAK